MTNIVILTIIPVEYRAILAHLPNHVGELLNGTHYIIGESKGKHHQFRIIIQQASSKSESIALMADQVIRRYNPVVVILAGVAGGVWKVGIGDVVVGSKYYGYEFGRETPNGFVTRPEGGHYSKELIALAQSVAHQKQWQERAKNATTSKVVFGPIASGNKVIAATDSATFNLLKRAYDDTVAVEMEAIGLGQAMQSFPSVRFLNVRGISDLLDGKSKSDASGSQELAADNMAAFVFELLYQLDFSQFKILGGMDVKELAKQVIEMVTQQDKFTGVSSPIQSIVQAIQPLIGGELEALRKHPQDDDAKADARSELRRALEGKEGLLRELEQLVKRANDESKGGKVVIKDSKNVIHGSRITVGGDFRVGDDL